jgi:sporulation protein YlmC with PRC-barrel domain
VHHLKAGAAGVLQRWEVTMRLVPLSSAEDYDFAPDTFDVRGWEIRTALDREHVGKVEDVLIDETGRPRYLDVDLGMFKKHVLVPLAQARVDGRDDVIWVDGLAKDQFEHIPEYTRDPRVVSADYERRLGEIYNEVTLDTTATYRDVADADETPGVRRLARLGELSDYRVAKGDTDPRGWDVITGDGERIGKVSELLVDTTSMEARYLDADVDEKKLELERIDRHILVPLDAARLDRPKKNVVVDSLFMKDLGSVPIYGGLPLTSDTEQQIRSAYRAGMPRPVSDAPPRESAAERLDEGDARHVDRFYGARRARAETLNEGEATTLSNADQEVRIRLSGDDIIIEKRPRG